MEGDLALRAKAVPFVADDTMDQFIYAGAVNPSQNYFLRVSVPDMGRLVECYLDLEITVASTQSLGIKVGIGNMSDYLANQTDISISHRKITGSDDYITAPANGTIFIDSLNLMPAMPRLGDPNFVDGLFVLAIQFDKVPDTGNGFNLVHFNIIGSTLLGVE